MTRYTTKADAISHAITPALGGYVDGFDIDAIFDEAFEYKVDTNEAGQELLNTAGFEQVVDGDAFWDIARKHDTSGRL